MAALELTRLGEAVVLAVAVAGAAACAAASGCSTLSSFRLQHAEQERRRPPPPAPGKQSAAEAVFVPGISPQTDAAVFDEADPAMAVVAARRRLMPKRIILVRHGQSEANADHSLLRDRPDNLVELTSLGSNQSTAVGHRIKQLVGDGICSLVVSPFERTLQTSRNLRLALDPEQIRKTSIEPRIREQEFGNLQGDEFREFRAEQQRVGRFWYRFPTGESGADVFARVSQWLDAELEINLQGAGPSRRVENLIVVTHGLTMRLAMMKIGGWSPNTFHCVYNAENCDMYVLKKDLERVGTSPYALDTQETRTTIPGTCEEDGRNNIKSSMSPLVRFKDVPGMRETVAALVQTRRKVGCQKNERPVDELSCFLKVEDYLDLPPPRTMQMDLAKKMIMEQHGVSAEAIEDIDFHAERIGFHADTQGPSKFR